MNFRVCAVIPCYNHHQAIAEIAALLAQQGLAVIIVDDASDAQTEQVLNSLSQCNPAVSVERLGVNVGKGGAVVHGLRIAAERGFSHALQVDADGQHDLTELPRLLELASAHPDALISGQPVYDASVPRSRQLARWLTHIWVWIETLSTHISDSMCGYRVYPLTLTLAVIDQEKLGQRMDFDPEIMVRLSWRGVPIMMTPVKVTYPAQNTSNFDLVADNWRITQMHTRLVFTLLTRLRSVWKNRPQQGGQPIKSASRSSTHWASLDERGMLLGVQFLGFCYRVLGRRFCSWVMAPVVLYFFLTGRVQRQASADYWRRIDRQSQNQSRAQASAKKTVTGWRRVFNHFHLFAQMALDKVAAWVGDVGLDRLVLPADGRLDQVADSGQGILVIASHLGNIEVSRALGKKKHSNMKITVFAHTAHAAKFNQLLASYNPDSAVDTVQVEQIGPATAIELEQRIKQGEWVVLAGDRVPVSGQNRVSQIQFLGDPASFSHGPIILAALLKCPVYMMLCIKQGEQFELVFETLADQVVLPRQDRQSAIDTYLSQYASLLEKYCQAYPEQWFNFFDFWGDNFDSTGSTDSTGLQQSQPQRVINS